MKLSNFVCLFQGILDKFSLVKFKDVLVKASIGLKSTSLGSAEWLEPIMLINHYSHFVDFHAGNNGSSSCQRLLYILSGAPEKGSSRGDWASHICVSRLHKCMLSHSKNNVSYEIFWQSNSR